jgi:virginiamycin B lyase
MIALRFTLAAALVAFGIGVSGCSLPGNDNALFRAANVPSAGLNFKPTKERVAIAQFADLPEYQDYYGPSAIAAGPKRSLWVTDTIDQDYGENAVVQIATSGKARNTFYYGGLTSEGADFMGITAGPDGALWITDSYNGQILRMTTGGTYAGFSLNNLSPIGIVAGPDRALWFTAQGGGSRSEIGRITTGFKLSVYSAGGGAYGITVGADKALWFTEETANAIGRITTKGKITEFTKGISSGADPLSIAAGPDGALWFTEYNGGHIGRITTAGKVTEYSRGITPTEYPFGIAAGTDGAMWFTESESFGSGYSDAAKIGRITMSGKISEYSKGLTSTSDPTTIVQGPDHNLWFVESAANKTGRASLP